MYWIHDREPVSQLDFSVIFGLDPEIHKFFVVGTGSPAFAEDDKIGVYCSI
jgi:hypothetical protein